MSGIGAVLSLGGAPVAQSEIERMRNVLKPHGPDRQKILLKQGSAFVACIHHLTPEDVFEQQPLAVSGRHVILFDGRLDNREDLAAALGIAPAELSSMP